MPWDYIWEIIMALVPPHDAEDGHVQRWRLVVALLLGGSIMATALHIAWACGFLTFAGLDGFAKADDLNGLTAQLASIQGGQLRSEIMLTRNNQCMAIKSQNGQALKVLTTDLQDALDRYQSLTKHRYALPDCSEF
jgi:hypothetical protein